MSSRRRHNAPIPPLPTPVKRSAPIPTSATPLPASSKRRQLSRNYNSTEEAIKEGNDGDMTLSNLLVNDQIPQLIQLPSADRFMLSFLNGQTKPVVAGALLYHDHDLLRPVPLIPLICLLMFRSKPILTDSRRSPI